MCIYGLIVLTVIGPFHFFNFFYLLAGLFLFLACHFYKTLKKKIEPKLFRFMIILFFILVSVFVITEARIISFARKNCKEDADYLIVLGSGMNEDGPSNDYRARLDSAYAYLIENKDTVVICTGAQGPYEPASEAQGGRDYLLKKGIEESRILLEDQSYNTVQNIRNSKALIEKKTDPLTQTIVIVSSDYHLFRASLLAKREGFKDVSCKGGHGIWILLPQYYTREFFALGKELLYR